MPQSKLEVLDHENLGLFSLRCRPGPFWIQQVGADPEVRGQRSETTDYWRKAAKNRKPIIPDVSRPLFRAQGGDWIDVGGAAGGQKTGKQRRNRQHQTGSKQCERIARTYIIQDLGQDAPRGQRKQNSDGNGERGL